MKCPLQTLRVPALAATYKSCSRIGTCAAVVATAPTVHFKTAPARACASSVCLERVPAVQAGAALSTLLRSMAKWLRRTKLRRTRAHPVLSRFHSYEMPLPFPARFTLIVHSRRAPRCVARFPHVRHSLHRRRRRHAALPRACSALLHRQAPRCMLPPLDACAMPC
jgi:hypothetical protein